MRGRPALALPARGEGRELTNRPGGFGLVVAGRHLVTELESTPGADEAERRLTAKAKVSAAFHTG